MSFFFIDLSLSFIKTLMLVIAASLGSLYLNSILVDFTERMLSLTLITDLMFTIGANRALIIHM